MTQNIPWMLVAVVLLAFPTPLSTPLWASLTDPRNERTNHVVGLLKAWQNWLDLLRAGLGSYVLLKLAPCVDGQERDQAKILLFQAGIFTAGLLIQAIRFHHGARIVAPIYYLSGLMPMVVGHIEGSFSVLVAWMFLAAGRSCFFFLPALGVSLAVCGFCFGISFHLVLSVILSQTPLVIAALFQKRLLFVLKQK